MSYFHSVTLDREKCHGCTNCIKRCPTEAIRVRGMHPGLSVSCKISGDGSAGDAGGV